MYAVCGNHDLLARGGSGYYWALKDLARRGLTEQDASFFCLHCGPLYSFVALDTSIEGLDYDSDALLTRLNAEQLHWLAARMTELRQAGRKAILLLHHPILACGPKFTSPEATHVDSVNGYLWAQLSPYWDVVCAAYWGHEHSFRVYQPFTLDGRTLQRGRLLGHGSKFKARVHPCVAWWWLTDDSPRRSPRLGPYPPLTCRTRKAGAWGSRCWN